LIAPVLTTKTKETKHT